MDEIFNAENFIIKLRCLTLNTNSKGFLHYLKSIDNKTQTLNVIMIYFFRFFMLMISKRHWMYLHTKHLWILTQVYLYIDLPVLYSFEPWQSPFQYKYVGYFRVAVLPLWQSKSINVYKRQPPNKSYYFWHKNTFSILYNIHIQSRQEV